MELDIKKIVGIAVVSAALGAGVVYFTKPTKVETKVETMVVEKEVEKKVYIDRVITKVTKPDGTIEERTEERDRSSIDEKSKELVKVEEKTITNPKKVTVHVIHKADVKNPLDINPSNDLGLGVSVDTGVLSTNVIAGGFLDGTVFIGIGINF